jgi:uncharacterized lipoprotein
MIRLYPKILILLFVCLIAACGSEPKPSTPFRTLEAYTKAIQKKDTTTMKLLLSKETIKMHEQEAKSQNLTLDDIVQRETLFLPDQKVVKFRNEKIDGDKATIEMENQYGSYDTVYFVKEEDGWKIDKQGFADQMMEQNDMKNNELDKMINEGKQY